MSTAEWGLYSVQVRRQIIKPAGRLASGFRTRWSRRELNPERYLHADIPGRKQGVVYTWSLSSATKTTPNS